MNGDVRISGEYPQQLCHREGNYVQQPVQGKYDGSSYVVSSTQGHLGSHQQQKTAAAFFAKKKKPGNLPQSPRRTAEDSLEDRKPTSFSSILSRCPPAPPTVLFKKILEQPRDSQGLGKVRVYLRVMNTAQGDFLRLDKKKKQVTLLGPERGEEQPDGQPAGDSQTLVGEKKGVDVLAPRMFAFDGVFMDDDQQLEVASSCLPESIQSVLSGTDATLFSFGHSNRGKTYTMLGLDESNRSIGIIPTAISWTYRCMKEMKEKSGMKLSLRISILEIAGTREERRDLLLPFKGQDGHLGKPVGSQLDGKLPNAAYPPLTEVRSSNAEKAGQLLDYALARRSKGTSHMMVTLHVYQQSTNSEHYLGKSRLNLIDFGYCERNLTKGGSITQAGLGHVILGILNGQRSLPFKESRVTGLLKECLGPLRSLVGMVAHVSPSPPHYSETLHTVQLASRIHRIRRKKKTGGSSGGSGSGSSDENRRLVRMGRIPGQLGQSSSDMTTSTDPSSSEQSCDTVIYLGPRDDEGTDAESPPVYLPTLNSGDNRGVMSRALRGSSAELPPSKYRSLDRKSSCASPRYSSLSSQSPPSSLSTPVPPSQLSTPVRTPSSRSGAPSPGGKRFGSLPRNPKGKMPLYGKVAGYKQPPTQSSVKLDNQGVPKQEIWVDSVPFCDKDVISVQYSENQSIYGYMDEHKKQMIQQWVEGQTLVHNTGPPSHLTGIESLAWLEAHSHEQNQYKVLTQFKMAESSTSSTSERDQEVDCDQSPTNAAADNQRKVEDDLPAEPAKSPAVPGSRSTLCVQPSSETRVRSPATLDRVSPRPAKPAEADHQLTECGSVGSGRSSQRSDRGTSTDEPAGAVVGRTVHPRQPVQDPYRAQRKVPLRRESMMETSGEGLKTLDELYTHCEQLVETLSQASEELRVQCQTSESKDSLQYLTVYDPELDPGEDDLKPRPVEAEDEICLEPPIDDVEVYEISEGSEGSIEVVDRSCQVSEDDIIRSIQDAKVAIKEAPEEPTPGSGGKQDPVMNFSFPNPQQNLDILEMQGVCEDVSGPDTEEFFNKKFDQLAKLHQLYQSVSSINAKCQSRLENDKTRDLRLNSNSLTSLQVDNSSTSSVSDDLNSLCSEPAWLNATPFLDINKNSTLSLNILDLCNMSQGKNSLSMTSLPPPVATNASRENSIMELNIESMTIEERCDSPILEGIDSELAKYAQLRNLQQAYQPKPMEAVDIEERLSSLRHPDGSSNPQLHSSVDSKSCQPLTEELTLRRSAAGLEPDVDRLNSNPNILDNGINMIKQTMAERSPGNGRSSSGSDAEDGMTHPTRRDTSVEPSNHSSRGIAREQPVESTVKEEAKETVRKEEKVKVPKFSRLFGNARKTSRSPSQVNKSGEEKLRSRSNKNKLKSPLIQDPNAELKTKRYHFPLIKTKSCEISEKKAKIQSCKDQKNVKGTLSSEPSCEKKKSRSMFRGLKKTRNQGVNLVSQPAGSLQPPSTLRQSSSRPASEKSGYDSGIDVTPRVRGKGANNNSSHSFPRKLSRAHCRSSGYESIGLESERESLDSCQGILNQSRDTTAGPDNQLVERNNPSPLPILEYDQSFVTRLDSLWRFQEIKRLKKQQETLKAELSSAKMRINVDPKRWSFDLHTQASGLDHNDPTFVEAFQRETEILGKRVVACQAHVLLTTSFDHETREEEERVCCCTTDCVPSWDFKEIRDSASNV